MTCPTRVFVLRRAGADALLGTALCRLYLHVLVLAMTWLLFVTHCRSILVYAYSDMPAELCQRV
jgi:hypothetical protein